ncbi:S-layer homology domain-containing protein [Leptolyngbya sp. 7M]|nr:S-layer homology domain-containing protein [Leptolyngbya sp. 7M]
MGREVVANATWNLQGMGELMAEGITGRMTNRVDAPPSTDRTSEQGTQNRQREIAELARRGMISGFEDGSFRPDQPVTRTQYATLVGEVLTDVQQESQAFPDVPVNFWGKPAIDEAVKSGFLRGYPDTSFQPNQPISRMEVLLSLVNGFQLPKPADPAAPLQVFQDRDQIPEWARPAVAAATQANVVVSHPNVNQFNPNQPATRAEVAAMLYQALTTTGQLPPIQSNYIVRP